jgi:hypothetical protein
MSVPPATIPSSTNERVKMSTATQTEIPCDWHEICGESIIVDSDELWYYEDGWMCAECEYEFADFSDGFPMSLEYDEGE